MLKTKRSPGFSPWTSGIPSGRALAQLVSYIAIQNVRYAKPHPFDGMVRKTALALTKLSNYVVGDCQPQRVPFEPVTKVDTKVDTKYQEQLDNSER